MYRLLFRFSLFCILLLALSCRSDQTDIKIGVIGDFSSYMSAIGNSGRNGIEMAVSEINKEGGISGRPVSIIFSNNQSNKERSFYSTKDLISIGVEVIIGPFTSGMVNSVKAASLSSNTLIISPTVSTNKLSLIDDNLIKMAPDTLNQGRYLAQIVKSRGADNILAIIDEKNSAYAVSFYEGVKSIIDNDKLTSLLISDTKNYELINQYYMNIKPDAVIYITSGSDTVDILESITSELKPLIYCSGWTTTSGLFGSDSKKIEGLMYIESYKPESLYGKELEFTREYEEKFGEESNISAQFSYEAVYLYKTAVENSGSFKTEDLIDEIINMVSFSGVSEDYHFNKYGDAIRGLSIYTIIDGQKKLVK